MPFNTSRDVQDRINDQNILTVDDEGVAPGDWFCSPASKKTFNDHALLIVSHGVCNKYPRPALTVATLVLFQPPYIDLKREDPLPMQWTNYHVHIGEREDLGI
ncbi:hypothetical protein Dda_6375 [Drechslerella dactyloides]|uniref:Uncharacterized protein n=1 Tax=Drechslerella dactyloides TaxID=74499 RepID=A0AAD6ITF7_DREDA|nr:hypothetical protein Dda_6375 [Drechslerella dactyloides]